MIFESINFYPAAFEKSLKDFIKHESHYGLTGRQLTEVFEIINPLKSKSLKTNQSVNTDAAVKTAD